MLKHIPNLLSVIRLLLIPVFWIYYAAAQTVEDFHFCGLLLVISGITDIMDGLIARKFNFITDLGKVLDPVADKLTQFTVAIAICLRHPWVWPLAALLAVKDIAMAVGGFFLYKRYRRIDGSRWYGKLATVIFYVVIILLVFNPGLLDARYVWVAMAVVGGSMLFAGIMYARSCVSLVRQSPVKPQSAPREPAA